jgi:hypothetical protein
MRRSLVIGLIALLTIAHAADIGVSPGRLELTIAAGEPFVTTISVLTSAGAEQQIAASIGDWTIDPTGRTVFLPPGSTAASASTWIELDADDFILPPRSRRVVRLQIDVPADAGLEGTYQTVLFFTVVPPPSEARGVGVVTTTRVGLIAYITIAGTERSGSELVDLYHSDDRTITAVILNTGNTVMRLGGEIQLRDEAGEVRHTIEVPDVPVLRESERELTFDLPDGLEPGFYVALALIQDSRGGVLAGELPLEVP